MSSDLDRIQAQAMRDATAVIQRAASYERQFDLIDEFLASIPLGRLHAICSTLAEHESRLGAAELAIETQPPAPHPPTSKARR